MEEMETRQQKQGRKAEIMINPSGKSLRKKKKKKRKTK